MDRPAGTLGGGADGCSHSVTTCSPRVARRAVDPGRALVFMGTDGDHAAAAGDGGTLGELRIGGGCGARRRPSAHIGPGEAAAITSVGAGAKDLGRQHTVGVTAFVHGVLPLAELQRERRPPPVVSWRGRGEIGRAHV